VQKVQLEENESSSCYLLAASTTDHSSQLSIPKSSLSLKNLLVVLVEVGGGSRLSRAVDFASRFVIIIESMNFELDFIESTNLDVKSTALENFEPTF
jgi:hypothetical protein